MLPTRSAGITGLPTRSARISSTPNRSARLQPHVRIDRLGLQHQPFRSARIWKPKAPNKKKNALYVPKVRPRQPQITHPKAQKCFLNLFKSFLISKRQIDVKNDEFALKILKSQISVFFCDIM